MRRHRRSASGYVAHHPFVASNNFCLMFSSCRQTMSRELSANPSQEHGQPAIDAVHVEGGDASGRHCRRGLYSLSRFLVKLVLDLFAAVAHRLHPFWGQSCRLHSAPRDPGRRQAWPDPDCGPRVAHCLPSLPPSLVLLMRHNAAGLFGLNPAAIRGAEVGRTASTAPHRGARRRRKKSLTIF